MDSQLTAAAAYSVDHARELLKGKTPLVLTGAGISTDSGIPDYRGEGRVARHPMTFDSFMGSVEAQKRYWARSFVGFSRISLAKPNRGHIALARAEDRLEYLITQNVDGLHQAAGSRKVVDLHGRLDRVICMKCSHQISRETLDGVLSNLNPNVSKDMNVEFSPDGDAEIEATANFVVPSCEKCGGVYKPDVVFFGESVPSARAEYATSKLESADSLLVVGSSLTVSSGLRFAKAASKSGKPIVIVNIGQTRADELASVKIEANSSLVLERLFE